MSKSYDTAEYIHKLEKENEELKRRKKMKYKYTIPGAILFIVISALTYFLFGLGHGSFNIFEWRATTESLFCLWVIEFILAVVLCSCIARDMEFVQK